MTNISISQHARSRLARSTPDSNGSASRLRTPAKRIKTVSIATSVRPTAPQSSQLQYVTRAVATVEAAVVQLFDDASTIRDESAVSREEAYSRVESIVKLGESEKLSNTVFRVFRKTAQGRFDSLKNESTKDGLTATVLKCEKYMERLKVADSMLLYLDQAYLQAQGKSVYQSGIEALRNELDSSKASLFSAFTNVLVQVRQGGDRKLFVLLERTAHVLNECSKELYAQLVAFVDEAHETYMSGEFQDAFGGSIKGYITAMLDQQHALAAGLHNLSNDNIIKTSLSHLPEKLVQLGVDCNTSLIKSGMAMTIISNNTDIAHLLARVSICIQSPTFYDPITTVIESKLPYILSQPHVVKELARLHRHIHSFIQIQSKYAPGMDTLLKRQANSAWVATINAEPSRDRIVSKALLKQADLVLRKPEQQPDGGVDLDDIAAVFATLEDQDTFLKLYQGDLSRRLIGRRSALASESLLVGKFGEVCGQYRTDALETMIRDTQRSDDLTNEFRVFRISMSSSVDQLVGKLNFRVTVGTSGKWPEAQSHNIKLARSLRAVQKRYETFYESGHAGRKLQWAVGLDMLVMRGRFGRQQVELSVNMFQATILLLFNKDDEGKLTYKDLREQSGLDTPLLNSTLDSLCFCATPILQSSRTTQATHWTDHDVFSAVPDLPPSTTRLLLASSKSLPGHHRHRHDDAYLDAQLARPRTLHIQASIVRHMKSARTLARVALYKLVCADFRARGGVSDGEFGKAVEGLMKEGGQYIARGENEDEYIYCI